MFPRLYALFLAGFYSASLSIPTLLHSRYFITIESQTWLAVIIIQFVLVAIAQLSLMNRIYTEYKAGHNIHMLINIIFVPVTCSLSSLSFVTLLSISFLYHEYGNKYIDIHFNSVTLDQAALLSVLHFQLLASISGGILFSLELYAELFRSTQEERQNNKKRYRKSITRSSSTFKPKSLDTIYRNTTTASPDEEEEDEHSTTEQIDEE